MAPFKADDRDVPCFERTGGTGWETYLNDLTDVIDPTLGTLNTGHHNFYE